MQLTPNLKMRVATRMLEGLASTWWEGVKGKYNGDVTWDNFELEFYRQYYSSFEVNQKRREYTTIKQGDEYTVKQLEQKFRDLARYLPEYAGNENRMVDHFWNALNLEVRERAAYQNNMTFNEVVTRGLIGEELWEERKAKDAEEARKRMWEINDSYDQSKRQNTGVERGSKMPMPLSTYNQGSVTQGVKSVSSRVRRCDNCDKYHYGTCREPKRCFFCGDTGHMKIHCPQRGSNTTSGANEGTMGDMNLAGPSQASTRHRGDNVSNIHSGNQRRTQR
ncbi:unnamed protein product [Cuscuta epithymum]|uniref:CCHC-type domain-containing protein n=1 Tax=Cuscuta epithymum TaxID=186058 RepID=A0AAV0FUP0_9ASTE|nr:unnamed protein product [Cuscuta epithymum]